ncbi:response regulator [Desulfococcaceae bacterium HSG7]|nr:response regulator [Desulfococcaceae bacterium HSG9]MDM8555048.1 response regulator [Desulfococcaceae bacterium HSG7]
MTAITEQDNRSSIILVVDDDPPSIGVIVTYLKDRGFQVVISQDGESGLKRAVYVRPDLILLDVTMPGIDGFETCRRLKTNENTKNIPVIFITALSDTVNKLNGFEAGGADYITKPFQKEEVLARVETNLSLRILQKTLEDKNARLEEKNTQLEKALADVKTLSGLLPICSNCKKIRDDKGYWNQIEVYIQEHSDAFFSHGLCKPCVEKLYGNEDWYKKKFRKTNKKT